MRTNNFHLFTTMSVLAMAFMLAACAKTTVTARRSSVGDEVLSKPNRIIVYSFAATPEDIPEDAAVRGLYKKRSVPQTPDEIRLGRQLGDKIAEELVQEILKLDMPAERSQAGPPAGNGDLIIKGEFVSIDEGHRLKRMLIGFGKGATELKTIVEAYQVTSEGPRNLGYKEITAAGGKMPGMLVPVLGGAAAGRAGTAAIISGSMNVAQELGPESLGGAAKRTAQEIAKELAKEFYRQGWIKYY